MNVAISRTPLHTYRVPVAGPENSIFTFRTRAIERARVGKRSKVFLLSFFLSHPLPIFARNNSTLYRDTIPPFSSPRRLVLLMEKLTRFATMYRFNLTKRYRSICASGDEISHFCDRLRNVAGHCYKGTYS